LVDLKAIVPHTIGIIGIGNIGSHIALNLARVGIEIFNLYDFDKVELHNTTSQAYNENNVGKYKVEIIKDEILKINSDAIVYVHSRASIDSPAWKADNDYLVVAVDTMAMRKRLAIETTKYNYTYPMRIKRVIDLRVGGEQVDVFNTIVGKYRKTIRNNPSVEPCGAQFVAYVSSIAGGLGAKEVIKAIQKKDLPDTISYAMDVRNMQVVNEI